MFQCCCVHLQALSLAILYLYFLLGSQMTGKLRIQSVNFSPNSSLQVTVYKYTQERIRKIQNWYNKHELPPARCRKTAACRAEVKLRIPLPHDAAGPAQFRCATLACVTIKNQSTSKLQLWLLCSALRSRKRHCVVVKSQGLKGQRRTRGGVVGWRNAPTSRNVAGSIPFGRPTALGPIQPLTEMSTTNIPWGVKAADA
jgi:hypothetical protein